MLLTNLFVSACILIASISLGNQIFKETGINVSRSMTSRVFQGFSGGILGVILVYFSLYYDHLIVLDFRNIAIILSSVYGGLVSAVITSIIISIFRIIHFGINPTSMVAVVSLMTIGIGCGLISQVNFTRWKKWSLITLYTTLNNTVAFYLVLKDPLLFYQITIPFTLGSLLLTFVLYYYTRFLEANNILFNKLKEEAKVDFLTGLHNVRQFDEVLNLVTSSVREKSKRVSLLYIDIDFFKKVNDTYGHKEGDNVLMQLAVLMKATCRSTDLIFRNGGEEFAIVLTESSLPQVQEIAERIRKNVENFSFIMSTGEAINVTVSIGIATYPDNVKNLEELKEKADIALYHSKRTGRNRVSVYSEKIERPCGDNTYAQA